MNQSVGKVIFYSCLSSVICLHCCSVTAAVDSVTLMTAGDGFPERPVISGYMNVCQKTSAAILLIVSTVFFLVLSLCLLLKLYCM